MRKIVTAVSILVGIANWAPNAAAQHVVSHEVVVKLIIKGSEVVGCGIEYVAAFRDHTYRGGRLSGISGSVSLIDPKDGRTPGMMFKLLGVDFQGTDAGKLQPFQIVHANVMIDRSVVGKGQPIECENPLGRCSIHQGDDWIKIVERIAKSSKLTVSFSRSATGLAVVVELPTDQEALESLLGCMQQLQ